MWDSFFYPHKINVRTARRAGGMGAGHNAERPAVPAEVRDEQRLVRNLDGQEVVSSTQVTVPLSEEIPVGSLVTLWPNTSSQREAEVLAVGRDENGDTDLDSFLVLSLT